MTYLLLATLSGFVCVIVVLLSCVDDMIGPGIRIRARARFMRPCRLLVSSGRLEKQDPVFLAGYVAQFYVGTFF